ncbi:MAG TPA: GGDEF domain-containing protein [Devosiaceae bacterium]|jgi:diguanylate cyclase (GGDEF)-like protein
MIFDQTSLMLAIGLSSIALCVTLSLGWLAARQEGYLLSWALGIFVIVNGVGLYALYGRTGGLLEGAAAYGAFTLGFAILAGAARQFRLGRYPLMPVLVAIVVTELPLLASYVLGFDGFGTVLVNLWAWLFLSTMAVEYWRGRAEAPTQITSLALLYVLTGLSFFACGVAALFHPMAGAGAPGGWIEAANSIMTIIALTGAGAVSLALNQSRLAKRHRLDAMTDALTGLLNRRALFDRHGEAPVPANTAVLVFDLDHFKAVNDQYGHAVGDTVLRHFADSVRQSLGPQDSAARFGGEEFAIVMSRATPDLAMLVAERIRAHFSTETIETELGPLRCTVSAGVAFAAEAGHSFDTLLSNADGALYAAKRDGRNRVGSPGLRLVA